jgi:hypothetical protein
MNENKIDFADIKALGFKVQREHDEIYEDTYGYPYLIVTLKLRKGLHIDWTQHSRECVVQKHKKGTILAEWPVKNLEELHNIIEVFGK